MNDHDSLQPATRRPRRAARSESNSELPVNSHRLVVTSQLHPFWSTKKGIGLAVVVVLALVGGIVGGVLGNKSNDEPARNPGSVPPPPQTHSSTTSMIKSESDSTTTTFEMSATLNERPVVTAAAKVIPTSILFSSITNSPGRNLLRYAGRPLVS